MRVFWTHVCHGGYDFPIDVFDFNFLKVPASYHNYHHFKNTGNFASTFWIWDSFFGTNIPYL